MQRSVAVGHHGRHQCVRAGASINLKLQVHPGSTLLHHCATLLGAWRAQVQKCRVDLQKPLYAHRPL